MKESEKIGLGIGIPSAAAVSVIGIYLYIKNKKTVDSEGKPIDSAAPDPISGIAGNEGANIANQQMQQVAQLQTDLASKYSMRDDLNGKINTHTANINNIRNNPDYTNAQTQLSSAKSEQSSVQSQINTLNRHISACQDYLNWSGNADNWFKTYPNPYDDSVLGGIFGVVGIAGVTLDRNNSSGRMSGLQNDLQAATNNVNSAAGKTTSYEQEISANEEQIAILTTELNTLMPLIQSLQDQISALGVK